MPVLPVLAIR